VEREQANDNRSRQPRHRGEGETSSPANVRFVPSVYVQYLRSHTLSSFNATVLGSKGKAGDDEEAKEEEEKKEEKEEEKKEEKEEEKKEEKEEEKEEEKKEEKEEESEEINELKEDKEDAQE